MVEYGASLEALTSGQAAPPTEGARFGVAMGEAPVLQIRENVTLTTCHPEYSWVNPKVWARGTVDLAKGEIRLAGYAA